MGHWIVIGKAPGWDDLDTFTANLKETDKWRLNPRTTVTAVIALADGRQLAECHADNQSDFEPWLQETGWEVESITPIKHMARTGEIWKLG
ncbi:MAG: hypothetical protein QGG19_05935 [Alphaproteobacteria bacterium]|jgi:hypothetical protein|nr:hypothetical protein [Rhodospirillaceae bacterium]MDP6020833.1 hypothetical protein [Alphaproteobacteria bacterium]MDP6256862.1 hypothetical protein [Alphaproteobacteria bacterium]MDP7054560.1 hypothetical protein [Alphaproteobacteria bacterium]MDP7227073.1 hypothetical protein [Alphaproteobacteria bacterium]|tara:strand:+ start:6702 stop:6974 length:273 start_codon:yes stop_codon:yes gene_type:complete